MTNRERVEKLLDRISANLFGITFQIKLFEDQIYKVNGVGRLYLQCHYTSPCTDIGEVKEWHGRKEYLSEFMTDDEVVKTAWIVYSMCVQHEVMEAFKIDNIRLFNPHVNFEELLLISNKEVKRK